MSDPQPQKQPQEIPHVPPLTLSENVVEYLLFVNKGEGDSRNSKKQLEDLQAVRKAALRLVDRIAGNYLWQREEFSLETKSDQGLFYLRGTTDYGDCIEDEWLIVYILRELTKTLPELWVRVFDGDGEFLLIEAANVIPKWLNPEIDANRVWIHAGKLMLVSQVENQPVPSRPLSLRESYGAIKNQPESLVHSSLVEEESFYRLSRYPAQISESIHRALVTIPRKLAYVLHERPKVIAPAIEAFYLRDPPALRKLASAEYKPRFLVKDPVTVSVRFTRVLFAQIRSQTFEAPRRWAELEELYGSTVPPDIKGKLQDRLDMGMKLTVGFELLARKAHSSVSRLVREVAILLDDLEEDGCEGLPTDDDIKGWKDVDQEDDEGWMNIDYAAFEDELVGKRGRQGNAGSGFGDPKTQADLKKIVSRFEEFISDEKAGLDGAELDDMDVDDDTSDSDSEGEDKAVSFDEKEFSRMMREMIGPHETSSVIGPVIEGAESSGLNADEDEVLEFMGQMEKELRSHGALTISNPTAQADSVVKATGGLDKGSKVGKRLDADADEGVQNLADDEGEVAIDYNLARNLLESFKGQAGLAGPAGNLLGMMGIHLPRDDDDDWVGDTEDVGLGDQEHNELT